MKKQLFFIFLLSLLLAGLIPFLAPGMGQNDFRVYWSAAALFAQGDSPYDPDALWALQQTAIPDLISSEIPSQPAWNPPWLILILCPLGFLPFCSATIIWMFFNMLLVGLALTVTWQLTNPSPNDRGILIVILVGYLFLPTIVLLIFGQVSSLVLIGIVLWLWCIQKNRDWLAGAALFLTTIKPHLSYFFLSLVLLWVIQNRRWKILGGMAVAGSLSLSIFFIVIPTWLTDYFHLLQVLGEQVYQTIFTSTLGSLMYAWTGSNLFKFSAVILLIFIPPLLRIVKRDGWLVPTNFALLSGIPLSPYGFLFDQVLLLPAIVQMIAWIRAKEIHGTGAYFLAGSIIMVDIGLLWMMSLDRYKYYYWFVWAPIALLIIYFIAWKKRHVHSP